MTEFSPNTSAKLYRLGYDDYSRDVALSVGTLKILIQEANSWVRGGNVQSLGSDSIAMVSPKQLQTLVPNGKAEGYLLQIEPYGDADWFRITGVNPARDLLQKNKVMHYELNLTRSKAPKRAEVEEES